TALERFLPDGTQDTSFGVVSTFVGGMILQPSGSVVVAQNIGAGLQLSRYDSTGHLDLSFREILATSSQTGIIRCADAVQDGEGFLVRGDGDQPEADRDLVLAHFDGNGHPDPDFAGGTGTVVLVPVDENSSHRPQHVALQGSQIVIQSEDGFTGTPLV